MTERKILSLLGDALEANEMLDVVSLDMVAPPLVTENGNECFLGFVDCSTRFCEVIPILSQVIETISREFVTRIVVQLGAPKKLLTTTGTSAVI
jgi:hypothetical protein